MEAVLIDHVLSLGAIGEVEGRKKLHRGDADNRRLEPFGKLACDLKARVVNRAPG
jgi:hypothetical protein